MFGIKKDKPNGLWPELDLDQLITCVGCNLRTWQTEQIETHWLAQARLADACRDTGIVPVAVETFRATWMQWNVVQRQQFGLLTATLDLPLLRNRLTHHAPKHRGEEILNLLERILTSVELLSLDVLERSDVRIEEFARHLCHAWQVSIASEGASQSEQRLHEINFSRLMKEAQQARSLADDRLDYLRELQQKEQEKKRPRRGKW